MVLDAAECAWRVRDNVDVFRFPVNRRRPIESVISNVAIVINCLDLIGGLIAHQDLTAQRPEA